MTPAAALETGLATLALEVPEEAPDKLLAFVGLMDKWNRTYNLTAVRDPLDMVTHHVLDSLAVLPHLAVLAPRIADVGSGAGLPGIPLAIARPAWQLTLNDASDKKAAFLRQAAIELGLRNVAIQQGRVEDWRPLPGFPVVISRAFAGLAAFLAKCRHLVAPGGSLVAMKGAAPSAGEPVQRVVRLEVPLLGEQRHLVFCALEG